MTLIFKTETAHEPPNPYPKITDVDQWPTVTRLSWIVVNSEGKLVRGCWFYIAPEDQTETNPLFGTPYFEKMVRTGYPAKHVVGKFLKDYESCDTMVAHDLARHYGALGAQAIRTGLRTNKRIENRFCTIVDADIVYPDDDDRSLPALWEGLFGTQIDEDNDTMTELNVMVETFAELKFRGIFKPLQPEPEQ